jgi:hypothetical protein
VIAHENKGGTRKVFNAVHDDFHAANLQVEAGPKATDAMDCIPAFIK